DIGSTGNQFIFAASPSLTGTGSNAVLPYATITGPGGFDFATIVGTSNGSVTRFSNYVMNDLSQPNTVVKLTSPAVLNSTQMLSALLMSGGATLSGVGTLTLQSGALAATGGLNTISISNLSASSGGELLVMSDSNSTAAISA